MLSALKKIHRRMPPGIKSMYMPVVSRCSYFMQYNSSLVRPMVYIYEGLEKNSRQPLTVAYAGYHLQKADHWAYVIFEQGFKRHTAGRRMIWDVVPFVAQAHPDCSLVLIEHTELTLKVLPAQGLRIPNWVDMSLDIAPPLEKLFATQRTYLKGKIKKYGFTYSMTKDMAAFDDFYHHMFMPYIKGRHGQFAVLGSYEDILKVFHKGELMLIQQDGKVVSAGLVEFTRGEARFRRLGVRDGSVEYVKQGAIGVLYYFLVTEMKKRGYSRLYIGGASPLLGNGVTRFKRLIGAGVDDVNTHSCVAALMLRQTTPLKSFWINNPVVILDKDRKPCGAFFVEGHEHTTVRELESVAQDFGCDGLRQRYLFDFGSAGDFKSRIFVKEPATVLMA